MDVPTPRVREKRAVKKTDYADLDSEATSELSDYEKDKPILKRNVNSKPKSAGSKSGKKTVRGKKAGKGIKPVTSKPEPAVTNLSSQPQSDEEEQGDDSTAEKPRRNSRQPNAVVELDASDEELSIIPQANSKPRPKTTKVPSKKAGSQKTNTDAGKKQGQSQTKRSKKQTTLEEGDVDIPPTKRVAVSKKKATTSKSSTAKSKLPSKKPRAKVVVVSSDDDDEEFSVEDTSLVPASKRPMRDRKQAVKYHESDDSVSEDN